MKTISKIISVFGIFLIINACVLTSPHVVQDSNNKNNTFKSGDIKFLTKPLMTLTQTEFIFTGIKINLQSLSKIKISGSSNSNTSEYSGNYIRNKKRISLLNNHKDRFFKIHWSNKNGKSFSLNIKKSNSIKEIRL